MLINRTRERLARGETVFGCGLQVYRSAEIPRAFAAAGFDYVFIDMEHGAYDLETVQDMIAASNAAGITPIVRVAELLYSLVARLLDAGAQGIILPRVEDPKLLAEAVSWMRFPPVGKRGYGVNPTMVSYEAHSFAEIIEHQNRNTVCVVQFETQLAMDRADELLSVPGVDIAMVGPADLSISLGVPGDFENPLLVSTVEQLVQKCNRHGVVPGIQTRTVAMAKTWAARGMRFVGAGGEHGLLLEKCKEAVSQLHAVNAAPLGR
ncbi:MAG TPA: aldolase/citrate lyase family protein [Candidatus Sulfopaludibacter sp.]|jgi:2-dehydro-3-deoxyglucarate aldolase/4-hydroxy-2-oxoheptanedioate aldolase|nr:aldolase/citrate lyase family protein [Candidatus Sulfopaludibacter sp.]